MDKYVPPPGTVAPPAHYTPPPLGKDEHAPEGEKIAWSSNAESPRPLVDLLHRREPQITPDVKAMPAAPVQAEKPAPKRRRVPVAVIAVVVAIAVGAVTYAFVMQQR